MSDPARRDSLLARFSRVATDWSGSSAAFGLAVLTIVVWLVSGPIFGFSDTWQLVINTGTTIVTFLMVFLIQRTQNKDSHAIHLKLNELVAAMKGASNRLINVEGLSEEEIKTLHAHYCKLVELARTDEKMTLSHSVEEASARHNWKTHKKTRRPARPRPSSGRPDGAAERNGGEQPESGVIPARASPSDATS